MSEFCDLLDVHMLASGADARSASGFSAGGLFGHRPLAVSVSECRNGFGVRMRAVILAGVSLNTGFITSRLGRHNTVVISVSKSGDVLGLGLAAERTGVSSDANAITGRRGGDFTCVPVVNTADTDPLQFACVVAALSAVIQCKCLQGEHGNEEQHRQQNGCHSGEFCLHFGFSFLVLGIYCMGYYADFTLSFYHKTSRFVKRFFEKKAKIHQIIFHFYI